MSRQSPQGSHHRAALTFLAFPLSVLLVFTLLPTAAGFVLSFFDWSGGLTGESAPRFVGLENFRTLWTRLGIGEAWRASESPLDFVRELHSDRAPLGAALFNTMLYMMVTLPVTTVLAFFAAAGLNAPWFRGASLLRTLYFVPTVLSVVAVGFVWRWILDPSPIGLLNQLWSSATDAPPPEWLGNSPWGLASIALVSVWRNLGFSIVMYQAALASISDAQYEAAAIDGASRWRTLWAVSWPSVRPTTAFLLLTGAIGALQVFDIVIVMIGSVQQEWTEVLNFSLYREFSRNRLGSAAAIGCLILMLALLITGVHAWWRSDWRGFGLPFGQKEGADA